MLKRLAAAAVVSALFPASAFALTQDEIKAQIQALLAQIAALQQQIAAQGGTTTGAPVSGNSAAICSVTKYPLKRGDRGDNVSRLQIFLKSQASAVYGGEVTGFFGAQTEAALTRFQLQAGIISRAGDGGVFGARTFQYVLGRFCTAAHAIVPVSTPVPNQCVPSPLPNLSCQGKWQRINNQSGCSTGWTCVENSPPQADNRPPLISAIVGPTNLKPDENGTWTVSATDPDGDSLVYSAVFGDEGANLSQLLNIAHQGTAYTSGTSFTHSYKKTGSYTIVIFAKDPRDAYGKATLTLQVSTPVEINPVPSPDGSCVLNGTTTKDGATIANPMCAAGATCSYPYLQCIKGQWVAIPSGGGSGLPTGACFLNGQGYTVNPVAAKCGVLGGASGRQGCAQDAQQCKQECIDFFTAPTCTDDGWANISWGGGYINPSYVTVGCTSSNTMPSPYAATGPIYVPGNMRVQGSRCAENSTVTPCEVYYICKRDGWWLTDGSGFEIKKQDNAPWILPEQFYPDGGRSPTP
ncbi:PKD domain-containing protein [Candidatus Kaiserbacteria bacterium]|nr:PKD domain-containing protein [Candidatus Kaiserbacteria bacterium]